MTHDPGAIGRQYDRPNLSEIILEALVAAGKEPDALTPDDLGVFDEFHAGLRGATAALAELAGLRAGMRVLDLGCGLGGPARYLARRYGCTVTGIDASAEFVRAARMLNARLGVADGVSFRHGDALDLPFEGESFDVVWTQHVSMNIEPKEVLYRGARRVLRSGGLLVFHDVIAGNLSPPHFPVPWADSPELSFLVSEEEIRDLVRGAGFRELAWHDRSEEGREGMRSMLSSPAPEPPPLGQHLYVENWFGKLHGFLRNLEENRVRLLQAVCEAV